MTETDPKTNAEWAAYGVQHCTDDAAGIVHALLAVADAIRDTGRHAPNERCGETRPGSNAAYPCILAVGHLPITQTYTHIDKEGDGW